MELVNHITNKRFSRVINYEGEVILYVQDKDNPTDGYAWIISYQNIHDDVWAWFLSGPGIPNKAGKQMHSRLDCINGITEVESMPRALWYIDVALSLEENTPGYFELLWDGLAVSPRMELEDSPKAEKISAFV